LRVREGIVLGPVAGTAGPDEFSGLLVEGVKAIARRTLRAPVGRDAPRDDEVAVNHRRCGTRVGEGEPTELLHERTLPEQLSLRREAGENSLRPLDEDIEIGR